MRLILISALAAFLSLSPAQAAEPSAASVQKLMDLIGASQMANQVINQMLPHMRQLAPQVPNEFWTDFLKRIDTKALTRKIIPVYQRTLDKATVDALIKFYESPAGQAFVKAQPTIMAESMKIGQEWGAAIGQQVAKELQARQAEETKSK